MNPLTHTLLDAIWQSLGHRATPADQLTVGGDGALTSAFPVTELATAAWAAAGLACAELLNRDGGSAPQVWVDQRLASLWFGWTLRPLGWTLPGAWDALAGDYATADGGYGCIPMRRIIARRWNGCWGRCGIRERWPKRY